MSTWFWFRIRRFYEQQFSINAWNFLNHYTTDLTYLFPKDLTHLDISWVRKCFTRVRKIAKSFVMSVCLSLRPHGTSRLPLVRLSWNVIFHYFSKPFPENSRFIKIWQEERLLWHRSLFTFPMVSRWILLRMKNISHITVRKLNILC